MYTNKHTFWINKPEVLLSNIKLVSKKNACIEEELNAYTRLFIFLSFLLLFIKPRISLYFLIFSILFIIIIYYVKKNMELQTNQVRENYESTHNKKERYGPSYSKNESSKNRPDWVTGHMYVSAPTPEQESKNNSCNDFRHSVKNPTKVLFPGGNAGNDSTFMQVDPVSAGRFCLPPTSLENNVFNNSNYVSNNQRLANAPLKERYAQPESRSIQQRAKISPIITKPSHDMEWITNSFVSSPPINSETNTELYNSGYLSHRTDCDYDTCPCEIQNYDTQCECELNKDISENPVEVEETAEEPQTIKGQLTPGQTVEITPETKENYKYPYETHGKCVSGCAESSSCDCDSCNQNEYQIVPPQKDDMVTAMGHFPEQVINNNLPSNIAVGECQKDESYKEYNKNIFTNIIQPGVYARSEVVEPITSNLGISTPLQFENVDMERDCGNGMVYLSRDPRQQTVPYGTAAAAAAAAAEVEDVVESSAIDPEAALERYEADSVPTPDQTNVYDPRFYGYGTSYRSYIDKMTGQPRFYYDDVDAQRRSNYVTKNHIDFTDYGTTTGPMNPEHFVDQKNVRQRANTTFVNNELLFRNDLQERMMRKSNQNQWQQRMAPIHTGYGSGSAGGSN